MTITPKQKHILIPRYFPKGYYKGEVKRPVREGNDLLANAPSLHCGTLYYPDGRRIKEER